MPIRYLHGTILYSYHPLNLIQIVTYPMLSHTNVLYVVSGHVVQGGKAVHQIVHLR